MSRVDVPTLKCDRCGHMTQDVSAMGRFGVLTNYHMSGKHERDLCPNCWKKFHEFINTKEAS